MKKLTFLFLMLYGIVAQAEIVDTFQFKTAEDRTRAVKLAKTLRCPQCQNQNLVESNSPIAYDLRIEVYKMVDEGKTNRQITEEMTARFGDFVLYKPPFQWTTALLWLLPLILLLSALLIMWKYLAERAKTGQTSTALSDEQKQALSALLRNKEQK